MAQQDASPSKTGSLPPKSREVRLGLVMYGGVSLAIYINGVAREFYRAVRGESVYKLIKAFTDSDIVVDIISGTSAGGINGILLGYALSNKADFSTTAELWRNAGNIGTLMHDPSKLGEENLSVLDGEGYFQRQVQEAFRKMDDAGAKLRTEDGDWKADSIDPSPVDELDVFITSTDLDGMVYTWFDAEQHAVDVKDHRAMFQLKFRSGRKNDFTAGGDPLGASTADYHRALAKLFRMTSCFPAAFPPVRLLKKAKDARKEENYLKDWEKPDGLIVRWGNIDKDESYFLDGGVLDNKPFTHTIREIFYRLAHRRVMRKLFYVEPDPEIFADDTPATRANVIQAVQRALISVPGYESISDDLKLLAAHNKRVGRYQRLLGLHRGDRAGALMKAAAESKSSLDGKSLQFIARMRQHEERDPPDPITVKVSGQSPSLKPAAATDGDVSRYATARLVTLSERAVRGILKDQGHNRKIDQSAQQSAAALYGQFDDWSDTDDPHGDRTLHSFDVYFRLRRLFHVLYACDDAGLEDTDADALRQQVQRCIGRQIRLLEIVRAAMEKVVDDGEFQWQEHPEQAWGTARQAYVTLLDESQDGILPQGYQAAWTDGKVSERWLDQGSLNEVYERLFGDRKPNSPEGRIARALRGVKAGLSVGAPQRFLGVLAVTDACERRMLRQFDQAATKISEHAGLPRLKETYDSFMELDADLFTLETFADLQEKDVIDTVRISPRDAQRAFSKLELKQKVAGDAIFHFGGFFKKSWRANDILWGRLDASCQLVECLLDRNRVREVIASAKHRKALQDGTRAGGDLHPEKLFPKGLPETRKALAAWFELLTSDDQATRAGALSDDQWDRHRTLLVESAQLEFLGDEVRNVLRDAVTEQMEWNAYRKTACQPGDLSGIEKGQFVTGNGRFDPTVHAVAGEAISNRAMERFDDPGKLATFFKNEYAVGSESIAKDVPPWTLLEIVFRGMLVAQACLAYALPRALRDKVKGSLLYRLVSGVLWLCHGLVSALSRNSRVALAIRWMLASLAAFSAVMALVVNDIACRENEFNATAFIMLVLPFFLLGFAFRKLQWLTYAVPVAAALFLLAVRFKFICA
ncbi:MAG: patatin-like protein [Betaproteobacteria bacterium]|nr:patatin-like protein [Betaproteobacteria bacterium]